ncbi:MAG TPA: hypothetical protein VFS05_13375 [Gemmatimonadaceae bacterium]|nr:hypothetical protein [Gemmatimonadaceae bacterium]
MRKRIHGVLAGATLLLAVLALPAAGQASGATPAPGSDGASAQAALQPAAVGPVMASAQVAVRLPAAASPAPAAAASITLTRPAKFLIFGGAIVLTGALIGDDAGTVLMIGGGAIALYGLYQMLFTSGSAQDQVEWAPPAPMPAPVAPARADRGT